MPSYVRGNVIRWTTTPYDVDGNVVVPESVMLFVVYDYFTDKRSRTVEIAMTPDDGDTWTAEWNSSVSIRGRVNWTIRAVDPSSADKGQFELT